MVCLTTSAIVPELRPSPGQEAKGRQLAIMYVSLLLAAIGTDGMRPTLISFGAEQFNENDPKQKQYSAKYFNAYFFLNAVAITLGLTVVVYIQDNYGWGWGLGIPSFMMFLSILVFVFGYPLYRFVNPVGSPYNHLIQVCIAAYKKRKLTMESEPGPLYHHA